MRTAVLCCLVLAMPSYARAEPSWADFVAGVAATNAERLDAAKAGNAGKMNAIDARRKALAMAVVGAPVSLDLVYSGSSRRGRVVSMTYSIRITTGGVGNDIIVKLDPASERAVYGKIGPTAVKGDVYTVTGKITSCRAGRSLQPIMKANGVGKK